MINGIRDETFRQKTLNDIFSVDDKTYIKNLMVKPQEITLESYRKFVGLNLYDSEKCHVCILVMETKK